MIRNYSKTFQKWGKYFIFLWCVVFLSFSIYITGFNSLFNKGPQLLNAQESDFFEYDTPEEAQPSYQNTASDFYEYDTPSFQQPSWDSTTSDFYEYDTPAYQEPSWDNTTSDFYEYDTPTQPAWDSTTSDFYEYDTPQQPVWDNTTSDFFEYDTPQTYTPPAYNPPVNQPPSPVYYPSPQYEQPQPVYQPPVQQAPQPQSQPQQQFVPQPVTPVTVEDYRCEGNDKVFYRVYINVSRAPERVRTEQNSPTCVSTVYQAPRPQTLTSNPTPNTPVYNQPVTTTTPNYAALSVNCVASPSQVRVGEGVNWRVITSGGSGAFNYHWSGDQSVNGQTGQTVYIPSYTNTGTKTAQARVVDLNNNNNSVTSTCSVQVVSNQTSTPTPTPTPSTIVVNPQTSQCPSGTVEKSRNSTQLVCEKPNPTVTTINASNPVQCPTGTIEKGRTGTELLCERPVQTITTQVVATSPTSTPTTTVITQATTAPQAVQCPSGTTEKSRTAQELICEKQLAQTQQSVTTTTQTESKQPVTVMTKDSTSIKELPKTGLPLAAIGFTALTPIGLRLKKLMGGKVAEESASQIWMKRQMGI